MRDPDPGNEAWRASSMIESGVDNKEAFAIFHLPHGSDRKSAGSRKSYFTTATGKSNGQGPSRERLLMSTVCSEENSSRRRRRESKNKKTPVNRSAAMFRHLMLRSAGDRTCAFPSQSTMSREAEVDFRAARLLPYCHQIEQ